MARRGGRLFLVAVLLAATLCAAQAGRPAAGDSTASGSGDLKAAGGDKAAAVVQDSSSSSNTQGQLFYTPRYYDGGFVEGDGEERQELYECLDAAVSRYNAHPGSLDEAGELLAHCVLEHLEVCSTMSGVAAKIQTIPIALLMNGLTQLVDGGKIKHAALVFKVYVTGASSSDSCAIKLYSALVTVILPADKALIEALASVIAYILASSVEAGAAASESACAADLPAVLLSVASVYCSQNEHMPTFYNSFTGFITTCTDRGPEYEAGPGAMLVASVLSRLMRSDDADQQKLALTIGFSANRIALAATQTLAYTDDGSVLSACLDGTKSLIQWLEQIPTHSGVATPPGVSVTAVTPSPDGISVACTAIHDTSNWDNNLLLQGAANIDSAIAVSIQQRACNAEEAATLCQVPNALWTFVQPADRVAGMLDLLSPDVYYLGGFVKPAGAQDYQCMTDSNNGTDSTNCNTGLPWGFETEPFLPQYHSLDASSPVWPTCFKLLPNPPGITRLPLQGGQMDTSSGEVYPGYQAVCPGHSVVTRITGYQAPDTTVTSVACITCSNGDVLPLSPYRSNTLQVVDSSLAFSGFNVIADSFLDRVWGVTGGGGLADTTIGTSDSGFLRTPLFRCPTGSLVAGVVVADQINAADVTKQSTKQIGAICREAHDAHYYSAASAQPEAVAAVSKPVAEVVASTPKKH